MGTVTDWDRAQAREVLHALGERPRIAADDGSILDLPDPVRAALAEVLEATAQGEQAVVVRSTTSLTTQEAAAVLGVSRPTVIRLVDAGKLPAQLVGTHRRLDLHDVLAYRESSATRRRKALDEMGQEAEDLGLYD